MWLTLMNALWRFFCISLLMVARLAHFLCTVLLVTVLALVLGKLARRIRPKLLLRIQFESLIIFNNFGATDVLWQLMKLIDLINTDILFSDRIKRCANVSNNRRWQQLVPPVPRKRLRDSLIIACHVPTHNLKVLNERMYLLFLVLLISHLSVRTLILKNSVVFR